MPRKDECCRDFKPKDEERREYVLENLGECDDVNLYVCTEYVDRCAITQLDTTKFKRPCGNGSRIFTQIANQLIRGLRGGDSIWS
jgi:hypothetical protein